MVFLTYGGFLGAFGTLLGVLAGSGICWVMTTFKLVRFDPEVAAIYFIDSVPFRVELLDVLLVVGCALLVTLLACFLPGLAGGAGGPVGGPQIRVIRPTRSRCARRT